MNVDKVDAQACRQGNEAWMDVKNNADHRVSVTTNVYDAGSGEKSTSILDPKDSLVRGLGDIPDNVDASFFLEVNGRSVSASLGKPGRTKSK